MNLFAVPCAILGALVFAGIVQMGSGSEPILGISLIVGGLVGLVGIYFLRKRLQREAEAREETVEARTDQLLEAASRSGEKLAISGSSGMAGSLLFVVIGGFMIWFELLSPIPSAQGLLMMAGGTFVLLVSMLGLVRAVPAIGRPVVELSRQGAAIPLYGFVPWDEVYGIWLNKAVFRDHVVGNVLILFVPGAGRLVHQMHPMERLMHGFRSSSGKKEFRIPLRNTSEFPEAVFAVAKQLWRRSTNRDSLWFPGMSDEATIALVRMSESNTALDKMKKQGKVDPQQVLETFESLDKDMNTVQESLTHSRNRLLWLAFAVMILLSLYHLWDLFGK